jgi:protein transport protein SEC13
MATTLASFEAGHGDMVHDVALDYYGRRLATASSDRCIKVFDVVGEQVGLRV